MIRHKIESDIWVPASIDEVWNFACDPKNLADISPKTYGVQVESDGQTQNGSKVLIKINPLGIPLGLKWHSSLSEVTESGDRRQFVDVQDKGPFAYWRHQHIFEAGAQTIQGERSHSKLKMHHAGTWIRDRVEYSLPLGILGEMAHGFYVKKSLQDMFWHRAEALKKIFSADPASST